MEQQLVEREGSNYSIDEYQSSSSSSSGDRDRKNNNNIHWTDEKHWHFLRFMEDAFVKSMFQINNNNGNASRCRRHDRNNQLRLDRHVPDSSESTSDVKKDAAKRRKNISYSPTDEAGSSTDDKVHRTTSSTRRQRKRPATTNDYSLISHDQECAGGNQLRSRVYKETKLADSVRPCVKVCLGEESGK